MTEQAPHRRGVATAVLAGGLLAAVAVAIASTSGEDAPAPPVDSTGATRTLAPTDDPALRALTDRALAAINDRDPDAMRAVSCDPARVGAADGAPPDAHADLVAYPAVDGATAVAQVAVTAGGKTSTVPLTLELRSGTWCVR
ncbi:hypothetical protein [Actinokineospora spheciospongiae]|uniref:hypothetical protein n=1 Tax=Actinokineospora spheciospongiae TaxID=909613 RepID=UPI000D71BEBD|nr:hypothetical protein [Actinokineospora spheciospongiae]PWW63046.1 hypothetical protein DFQ13_10436 [Actinokineospora spheciospongiae]